VSRRQMCATIRLSVTSASAAVIVGGIIVRIGTAPAYSRLTERHAAEATCIIQRATWLRHGNTHRAGKGLHLLTASLSTLQAR